MGITDPTDTETRRAVAALWIVFGVGVAAFGLLDATTGLDVELVGPGAVGAVVVLVGATVVVGWRTESDAGSPG